MLRESLREYVAAGFSGIWIQSHEHDDAIAELAALCREHDWLHAVWDIDAGLSVAGQPADLSQAIGTGADPLAAIRSLRSLQSADRTTLLVLVNFHRFLNAPEIVQSAARQIAEGKRNGGFIVILSPVVQIPAELEKSFVVVEHELPSRDQLLDIARGIATEPGDLAKGEQLQRLLDAAAGLTRLQAEGAFGLSLVRHGRIDARSVWEIKAQEITKSGLMRLHRGGETFSELGGLDSLKSFCTAALRGSCDRPPAVRPRGVLLLGAPGTGKSAFAKALGTATQRPTLVLDIGALMGSLVGATERNVREALRIADAMAPSILYVDEIDKGLAGVGGTGDSGVTTRLFGSLLTWLAEHDSDVFFIGTANDVSKLPPEFTRSERLDGVFFLDLPGTEEKQKIWSMYRSAFRIPSDQRQPNDSNWTGAEIRSCCRLAALLNVPLTEAASTLR